MIESQLPPIDRMRFRVLAMADSETAVIIREIRPDQFVVVLKRSAEGELELLLGREDDAAHILTFEDLGECVRETVGLTRTGEILFENRVQS